VRPRRRAGAPSGAATQPDKVNARQRHGSGGELRHRRRILLVMITLSWQGAESELVAGLRGWLGGWPGIGRIVLGMVRQG
jgi:hypothetical protein